MLDLEQELFIQGVPYRVSGVTQYKSNHFRVVRTTVGLVEEAKEWVLLDSRVTPVKQHVITEFLNPFRQQDRWHLACVRLDRVEPPNQPTHKYCFTARPQQDIKAYLPKPVLKGGSSSEDNSAGDSDQESSSNKESTASESRVDLSHRVSACIVQWNINGWRGKSKEPPIKQFLVAYDPVTILLNEPR
jgi:hypothetical protein